MPTFNDGDLAADIRTKLNGTGIRLNNFVATAAPTTGDDTADGYEVGSRWFDVTNDRVYECLDATATAAVWVPLAPATVIQNAQTGTSYTFVLGDSSKLVTMNNAAANSAIIPANAAVAFPIGTVIVVQQIGAGATTIDADTGVTLNGVSAGNGLLTGKWGAVSLMKIATDTWLAMGAIGTVA